VRVCNASPQGLASPLVSSGENAQAVVEVLSGFVQSAHRGHVPVSLPLERSATDALPAVVEEQVAAASSSRL